MRKYLYTTLLLALLAQEGVMAQENEGKKGGFFGKIKDTFSTEIWRRKLKNAENLVMSTIGHGIWQVT